MVNIKYITTKKYQAGRVIPPHGHNLYEIVYYVSAKGVSKHSRQKVSINDGFLYFYDADMSDSDIYEFENDSFTLIQPSVLHSEQHFSEASIITLGFTMDSQLPVETNIFIKNAPGVKSYINRILEEYNKKQFAYDIKINCIITELLIYIKRMYSDNYSSKEPIDNCIAYIDEYFMDDISIPQLAKNTGYSADHFSVLFKNKTGLSVKRYIINKRLDLAKRLLQSTSLSVAQISESCGFKYSSQFTKIFIKYNKISPLQYRHKFRDKDAK
ncbi:MAG TPA: AraC family transcriptional regulator [Clostridia bacterium]